MKKILAFSFLLINVISYSQDNFKKIEKGNCKIEHKCKLTYKYDEFDDKDSYQTISMDLGSNDRKGFCDYILSREITKHIKTDFLYVYFSSDVDACVNNTSYVHLILNNDEKLILESGSSLINCGSRASIMISLSKDNYDAIIKLGIKKIRLQFLDNHDDIIVSEKENKKFIDNLKCISLIQ